MGHINFASPKDVVGQIRTRPNQGTVVRVQSTTGNLGFLIDYRLERSLTDDEIDRVALGILQDFTVEFEYWQRSLALVDVGKIDDKLLGSWFANEDTTSDQVGFIAAIQGKTTEEILFGTLGATTPINELPGKSSEEMLNLEHPARNFEFRPRVKIDGEYVNIDFPSNCQLNEPLGINSGRWSRIIKAPPDKTGFMWNRPVYSPDGVYYSDLPYTATWLKNGPWPNEWFPDPRKP